MGLKATSIYGDLPEVFLVNITQEVGWVDFEWAF